MHDSSMVMDLRLPHVASRADGVFPYLKTVITEHVLDWKAGSDPNGTNEQFARAHKTLHGASAACKSKIDEYFLNNRGAWWRKGGRQNPNRDGNRRDHRSLDFRAEMVRV